MINEELIETKIDSIYKNLQYLEEIKKIDEKEFQNSFEKVQATKHSLQESIEASLDIANHIISSKNWERTETYAEMFERLHKHQIINKNLKDKLSNMAKFRNILVHRYGKIDDKRILKITKNNIKDIEKYIEEIEKFLEQTQPKT